MVYKSQFLNANYSDVSFSLTGSTGAVKTFPAHKIVLVEKSTVFAAMFENNMSEKLTGTVKFDVSESTFLVFLKYFYTNKVTVSENANIQELLQLAENFVIFS